MTDTEMTPGTTTVTLTIHTLGGQQTAKPATPWDAVTRLLGLLDNEQLQSLKLNGITAIQQSRFGPITRKERS